MTSPYSVKIPVQDANGKPATKTYFQVILRYNTDAPENSDISVEGTSMESPALESEAKAEGVLKAVCKDIQKKVGGSEVVRIPLKDRIDDFSVVVIRERKSENEEVVILARLGIIKIDYSGEIIH